jgi:hypothetical protein
LFSKLPSYTLTGFDLTTHVLTSVDDITTYIDRGARAKHNVIVIVFTFQTNPLPPAPKGYQAKSLRAVLKRGIEPTGKIQAFADVGK